MTYSCRHASYDGYYREVKSHYGTHTVWVCGECGEEIPIDKYEREIK